MYAGCFSNRQLGAAAAISGSPNKTNYLSVIPSLWEFNFILGRWTDFVTKAHRV